MHLHGGLIARLLCEWHDFFWLTLVLLKAGVEGLVAKSLRNLLKATARALAVWLLLRQLKGWLVRRIARLLPKMRLPHGSWVLSGVCKDFASHAGSNQGTSKGHPKPFAAKKQALHTCIGQWFCNANAKQRG